jgi:hypothetical protein
MSHPDPWNHDPSVQMMRRIFLLMEKSQKELLHALEISPIDSRLQRARPYARDLFEQMWPVASQKGIVSNEDEVALLYRHCLSHALRWSGVKIERPLLPKGDKVAAFLQEKLK